MSPDDLRRADAIEVVVGQGAKPGGGGMLLGHKISDRVAAMRTAGSVGMPTCSMKTSCVAAVPPCMRKSKPFVRAFSSWRRRIVRGS